MDARACSEKDRKITVKQGDRQAMTAKAKKDNRASVRKVIIWLWVLFFAGILMAAAFFFALSRGWIWELPSFEELENPKALLATEIYTSDRKLLGKYYRENRTLVRYENLPKNLIDALIATEDVRFYDHSGIDFRRTLTATLFLGKRGGASTITQQLAKLLFHERATDVPGRLKQKLLEWVIAIELEKRYTKEEILTMYLNKFDFINNAVGIQSAASIYFNTVPDSLKIDQSALLVGMCKNPWIYNPVRFPENAKLRRNTVFNQMLKYGYITQQEADSLKALPVVTDFHRVGHTRGKARYFREVLRAELAKIFNKKDANGDFLYKKPDGTPYDIYKDGLKVYTTIDSRLQDYAEWAVAEHLGKELQKEFDKNNKKWRNPPFSNDLTRQEVERIMRAAMKRSDRYRQMTGKMCPRCGRGHKFLEEQEIDGIKYWVCKAEDCQLQYRKPSEEEIEKAFNTPVPMKVFSWKGEIDTVMTPMDSIRYYKGFLQSGLMAMDPHTGQIKAWVGGIDYKYFRYDHVKQGKRQVGSTFKPFVYSVAIQNGLDPCYEVPNLLTTFKKGEWGLLKDWTPKNSEGSYGQMVTLRYGLANSLNTVTAWVMKQFGPPAVIDMARRMGITSRLDTVPALALGVADISLYEMVGAFSAIANQGLWQEPIFISRIEDKNGVVIVDFVPESREALSEEDAYKMLNMLQGVTNGAYGPYLGKAPDKQGKIVKMGTGIRIHSKRPYAGFDWNLPIAGKTGTTQNNSDGWFMGITPDLVAGVWVGAEDRSVRFRTTYLGQGANTALPIWGYFMKKAWANDTLNLSKEPFKKPAGTNIPENCKEKNNNEVEPDEFDPEIPSFN